MNWTPIQFDTKKDYKLLWFDDVGYCAIGCWSHELEKWVNDDGTELTPFDSEPTHSAPYPEPPQKTNDNL